MLLSTLLVVLTTPVWARPTPAPEPVYHFDPLAALAGANQAGPSLPRRDLARLAQAADDAYCPERLDRATLVAQSGQSGDDERDVGWYITQDRRSRVYTLAFSSPGVEDLLELLASASPSDDYLIPVSDDYLPASTPTPTHANLGQDDRPSIFTPFEPYLPLVSEATDALTTHLNNHLRPNAFARLVSTATTFLGLPNLAFAHPESVPDAQVEIVGHGLGSVLALLSSLRLTNAHPELTIRTALFSMPKVGDASLALAVDEAISARKGKLSMTRVTNDRDPIPDLPPRHYALQHPTAIEVVHLENRSGSATGRSRLDDSRGPYEGVMIGQTQGC